MRRIEAAERRARLARRHALLPGDRAADPVEAARRVVCLHATDPGTVYLSAWARVEDLTAAQMDDALYADRSLVRHLAMRRTLFAFPRALLGAAQAGASARVADAERRRVAADVEKAGLVPDGSAWLSAAGAAVLATLEDGRERTSSELREEIPLLEGSIAYGAGKRWGGSAPVGPRVLTVLSAEGRVVRASNLAAWTSSRPRWTLTENWLGGPLPRLDPEAAVADLVHAWLSAYGPGTEKDLAWWLGGTLTTTRRALAGLGVVEVDLDGAVGYVLPDDVDPVDPVPPWAALLPSLDPTTMGWARREWYLGAHRHEIFDRNGNGGASVWWDGRIVGGWAKDPSGDVVVGLLEDVGVEARRAVDERAAQLTDWLGGTRLAPRFPAPMAKALSAGTSR